MVRCQTAGWLQRYVYIKFTKRKNCIKYINMDAFVLQVADSAVCGRHGGAAGEETGEYKGAGQHLRPLHVGQRLPHRCEGSPTGTSPVNTPSVCFLFPVM